MIESSMELRGFIIPVYRLNTVVVGSGAAGYNAARRLHQYGQRDIALVTEHINAGTSRNTGSDKQTYYKLTLSGGDADSVSEMAETLFSGQCMDGDNAQCEAALSAQCFLSLAEAGVPFPRNRYGEYIGYKTDHDPRRRATSIGPYTSRRMTECLQAQVEEKGIPVFDKLQAVRILTDGEQACGLLCLDLTKPGETEGGFVVFNCRNIVWATGGPAGMYADSVYPHGHYGASGLAFEAGALGQNLTEWQYGLASIKPRWNVSGTYMQVLPRFVSTDKNGAEEREFLFDFFSDTADCLSKVFLKGYQWPFDVRKVKDGSSIIDILVHIEKGKGRRVFLDFRSNPLNQDVDFGALSPEAAEYLNKAGACFGTPIERLLHMNEPAVAFYREKGVNLEQDMLEIALCAQHNNGGIAVDCWWQSTLPGLFSAGEAAGSHGVYRPGGSALNSGQVGSTRCAQYLAKQCGQAPMAQDSFNAAAETAIAQMLDLASETAGGPSVAQEWEAAAVRMSRFGAAIRSHKDIQLAQEAAKEALRRLTSGCLACSKKELPRLYRLRDMLISQQVYLSAMADYIEQGGKSRGSALYTDAQGQKAYPSLPGTFTFTLDDGSRGNQVQQTCWSGGQCRSFWRMVRPIPDEDDFFENVWRAYRQNENIF
jgi:succinate dehydrogenase / fumarate reductase flavoprotein subunit